MAWRLLLKRSCSTGTEVVKSCKDDMGYLSKLYCPREFQRETEKLKAMGKYVPSVYAYESKHLQKWGVGTKYLSAVDYMWWFLRTPLCCIPQMYKYIEMNEIYVFGSSPATMLEHPVMFFQWLPPSKGWWKLNFHGSIQILPDGSIQGGYGSIIRDVSRSIVSYDYGNEIHGVKSAYEVELLALYHGLQNALKEDFKKVIIEGHCMHVLDLFLGEEKHPLKEYIHLYRKVCDLLSKFQCIAFSPVERETNRAANTLAEDAAKGKNLESNYFDGLGVHDLHDLLSYRITQDFERCPLHPLTQGLGKSAECTFRGV